MTDFAKAFLWFCPDLIAWTICALEMRELLFNLRVAQLEPIVGGVIYRRVVIAMIGTIGLCQSQG